jgi:hypothetical protein
VSAHGYLSALKTVHVPPPLGDPQSTSLPGTVPTLGGLSSQRHVNCISTVLTSTSEYPKRFTLITRSDKYVINLHRVGRDESYTQGFGGENCAKETTRINSGVGWKIMLKWM